MLTNSAGDGLAVFHRGRAVRLKWHRMRRRIGDPLFGAETMRQGFRLGASMEVDLRVRGDGGFVVLHDETLDRETTGAGPVASLSIEELRRLHFQDMPTRPLLLTEDLAASLGAAHPDALLQFDMKDDLAAIGDRGLDHLARLFSNAPCALVVSGGCLDLVVEVRKRMPNLLRGIDPTDKLTELLRLEGPRAVEHELLSDLAGAAAPHTIYLGWQLILRAKRGGLDLVDICRSEGKRVDAWTFTPRQPGNGFSDREWDWFSALLEFGVDQITTDEAVATEHAYWLRMQR